MSKIEKDVEGKFFAIKLSFAFGFVMLLIKWYAYFLTNSSAILSDAAESIVHIIGVGFAVFSLWYSQQPADDEHNYGHEKITYFSAGFEGGLIILAALYIIFISINRLIYGIEISNIDQGTFFTIAASIINLFLGLFLIRKGKKTDSLILIANGKHVLTDSWTSFGVVIGLLLTWFTGWLPFDPIIAIVAAINILFAGGSLIRKSVAGLMDEVDIKDVEIIKNILSENVKEKKLDFHKLRIRESGETIWVDFHLLFPKNILLENAHNCATEIENKIKASLNKKVIITSHLETLHD
ncbi:MAG: cation transporter [Ignavibacteriales bacterium]|nr:cation transporter [Ignavibacteriales bacterium]MBK7978732.1 cation transporter [Ignavibacteriota bacterium]